MTVVIRHPCLPEDEGAIQFMGCFDTRAEAEKWLDDYTKDGYFRRSNFEMFGD